MEKLFLVTVDGDLHTAELPLQRESLQVLLDTFEKTGAAGHITWFVNENVHDFTRNHPDFLHQVIGRDDVLGVHDHYEPLGDIAEFGEAVEFSRRSKERVEGWLADNNYPSSVRCHRNGCLVQKPNIYRALQELGYTHVSEIVPGDVRKDHNRNPALDNSDIPPGINPYRHDYDNFLDYTSRLGHFIQFPAMEMFLNPCCEDGFRWEQMRRWDEAFANSGVETACYLWLFHPYEVMDQQRTVMDWEIVGMLEEILTSVQSDYACKFVNIEEAHQAMVGG